MVGKLQSIDRRLFEPKCLQCGKHCRFGDGLASRCAKCGCDFQRRPPRSYAEMEGLVILPAIPELRVEPWSNEAPNESKFLQRWLAFVFGAMIFFMMLLFLAGELVKGM